MSAAAEWVPAPALRDAVEAAYRFWKVHHPNRRVPADHDHAAEFREYCRAMSMVHVGSVADVAEAVLDSSKGHWPSIAEVKKCARAFAQRQADREAGWPDRIDSVLYDDFRAVDAQCAAILRGLDLDGPDVGHRAKWQGIAAVMDAVTYGVQQAVRDGTLPKSKLAEFRAGTYPSPATLERRARDLAEKARHTGTIKSVPVLGATVRAIHAAEIAAQSERVPC